VTCSEVQHIPLFPSPSRKSFLRPCIKTLVLSFYRLKMTILAIFVLKGMAKNMTAWCRDCQDCFAAKSLLIHWRQFNPSRFRAKDFCTSTWIWSGLFPQLVLRSDCGQIYSLSSATWCTEALFSGWIARFGVPSSLLWTEGTEFSSDI
jgi:hypothetical protein